MCCFVSIKSSRYSMSAAGTCINNTSVMMFKKGSFEIACTVYPVAIKVGTVLVFYLLSTRFAILYHFIFILQYDPRFGDAFWNSSKFGMVYYLLRMMSSWAVVCSVWYLPPMNREVKLFVPITIHRTLSKMYCISF